MAQRVADFRSDTVTGLSAAMRQAMVAAEMSDDPAANRLQEHTAEQFGKEDGLFAHPAQMGNQAALHSHTRRGDEVFLRAQAHIIYYEQGGAAALSSIQLRCFNSADSTLNPGAMEEHVHSGDNVHVAPTCVATLKDTHSQCCGLVCPLDEILCVREFWDTYGLVLHLDGVHVWNAHAAGGVPLADIASPFDSVSVRLSRELGAPVGAVLLGRADFIRLAMRVRNLFGDGMPQAGILSRSSEVAEWPPGVSKGEDCERGFDGLLVGIKGGCSPICTLHLPSPSALWSHGAIGKEDT